MARRNLKLLLLGTGESGKSTFIRQMRIIHEHGYETIAERMEYVSKIHQNLLTTILTIDHAMQLLNITYEDPENVNDLKKSLSSTYNYNYVETWRQWLDNTKIRNCSENNNDDNNAAHRLQSLRSYQLIIQMIQNRLPSDLYDLFYRFWIDTGVRRCVQKRNEYDLLDSSTYYMERLNEILNDSYVPSVQDILHVRIPTNGINEYNFEIDSVNFMLVDVGGQRTERRKWIHCFESVTTIIYIVALSEFDQIFWEPNVVTDFAWRTHHRYMNDTDWQKPVNKLAESKALFKTIITSRWFRDTSIVLFLNKYDLFEEKILHGQNRLEDFFPDYNDEDNNVEMAADFILRMFFEQDPEQFRRHVVYTHFTCATDTGNIKIVFQAVKDTIMEQLLSKEIQIF
ncbi:hypothetical protein BLA29_002221 [Euroglyphus maynei]|uniref:Guanine nucleotide-binding protein G(Q) subunit alpha-like protein n=1 Tax=Euroglyphus maynei TaxID=6958 RepID=A0A1Y3BE74_EURMA|nr:hypothetical protein BLA29_002221 [Euroglyphus maynei]